MASKIVEREGRAYLLEDGKVVKSASTKAELLPESPTPIEFSVGDRVEADGKLGKVVSKMNTIYGLQYGVREDDGEAYSYYTEQLAASEVEEPVYESPIHAILTEADEYETLPSDTVDQITAKSARARELNLRAKALASDSKLSLADRVKLDAVVSGTQVDLDYLADDKENALLSEHEEYLAGQPKYEVDASNFGSSEFSQDDASWLGDVADEAEAEFAARDQDVELTEAAVKLVEGMNPGLLSDDDIVMEQSHNLFLEVTAGLDDDTKADKLLAFNDNVRMARTARLEDLKEAVVDPETDEEDLGDDSDLFL
jgi:hypothetical protein